jgi:hypothetical protein
LFSSDCYFLSTAARNWTRTTHFAIATNAICSLLTSKEQVGLVLDFVLTLASQRAGGALLTFYLDLFQVPFILGAVCLGLIMLQA